FELLEILYSTILDLLLELTLVDALGFPRLCLLGGIFLTTFAGTGFLGGTTVVEVILVKGHLVPSIVKGLRGSRKLKPGALRLYMGNGQRAEVEAIRSYYLSLPSGLVIVLNNYHYGFDGNTISVSRNNVVYFSAVPRDGIYEIDLSNSNTNNSSMYVVSNKRAKLNLDSTLLWHCRLRHISKKCIEKLQHDGLLNSTNIKSFENRYGYVYLLKHKHEVFETFKVFQKEVENQLGKTIKSLRSDRGGKYMIQEFFDHLKEYEIIAYRTPPYTPQHNGVSERRNRTLLDMVRSMMSQTTLPKSFWDYALKSATHILNMVPTKKVEKTPYEETMGYSFYYPPENKVFVAWNVKLLEDDLITQESSGSLEDLEIIQKQDTHPSENTSIHHDEGNKEIDEPQSDIIPIRREYKLGDLNKPGNYKAALLDPESDKWLDDMNVEMQSMNDNEV
ncbi:retrotransposon protein, putative, ty1-copia subclass, partial [Tanacetum coccineum]